MHIRIIKMGGAAFTDKSSRETLHDSFPLLLSTLCSSLKLVEEEKEQMREEGGVGTILIHGAGSFGHFDAKKYCLQQGIAKEYSQEGIALTRRSVTKLNGIFINKLVESGLPAVGVSPFGSWETTNGQVTKHNISDLSFMLSNGLIPVLHGDVVMDREKGCTILSGDTIAETISAILRPKFVVFITDVAGVYDIPPHLADAKLLRNLSVPKKGKAENPGDAPVTSGGHEHDVTGGMTQKLWSAKEISSLGITVHIINSQVSNLGSILKWGDTPKIGTTIQCKNE